MMRKLLLMALLATLCLSCAGMDTKANDQALTALARLAGVAAEVYLPGSMQVMQEVCTASGMRDRDLMVKALQQVWTEANKEQATVVVESLNDLVGATGIVDAKVTDQNLSKWQETLGAMCCATGKCVNH